MEYAGEKPTPLRKVGHNSQKYLVVNKNSQNGIRNKKKD